MAGSQDLLLHALSELIDVTKSFEETSVTERASKPLSRFVEGHYDTWAQIFLAGNDAPPLPELDEFLFRVADAKRHAKRSSDDFEQAVVDALKTSLTMYRGLPGKGTLDPPMPPPREERIRERAIAD